MEPTDYALNPLGPGSGDGSKASPWPFLSLCFLSCGACCLWTWGLLPWWLRDQDGWKEGQRVSTGDGHGGICRS